MVCIKETNFYLLVWHSNHTNIIIIGSQKDTWHVEDRTKEVLDWHTSLCFSLLAAYDESMEAFPTNSKVSEDFGTAKDICQDGLVLESKEMMDHLIPNEKDKIVQKIKRCKKEEYTSYVSLCPMSL